MDRISQRALPAVALVTLVASIAAVAALVALPQAAQAKPPCFCTDVWNPVCGADGVTYSNSCRAGCAGVSIAYPDQCAGDSISYTAIFAEAEAQPAVGTATVPAVPAKSCICPDVYAPVCGVDGITYSNSCDARCAGVAIAYTGPCGGTDS